MRKDDPSHEPYELFRVRSARIRVPPRTQRLVTENAVYAHQRNHVVPHRRNVREHEHLDGVRDDNVYNMRRVMPIDAFC